MKPILSGHLKVKKTLFWNKRYGTLTPSQLVISKSFDLSSSKKTVFNITTGTTCSILNNQKIPSISVQCLGSKPIIIGFDTIDEMITWYTTIKNIYLNVPTLSMNDFEILSVIGRGFYGKVLLCRSKSSNQLIAIKTIHKNRLIRQNKAKTVFAERNVLLCSKNPFIVSMKFTFQTETKLYLGLEYIPGGELFARIHSKRITFHDAQMYIAEIAIAINYLHSLGIIYRDLKPENILINNDGHLKLTDFGFSKYIIYENANTFCGTAEFLSPEIIQRRSYGFSIDWWALGIILFEIIYGKPPFHSETNNKSELYKQIIEDEPTFPENIPYEYEYEIENVKDLSVGLLNKNPSKRITFDQLKEHPFFNGMDFSIVYAKRILPDYIPKIHKSSPDEHFSSRFTSETPIDSAGTPTIFGKEAFHDFDFIDDDFNI